MLYKLCSSTYYLICHHWCWWRIPLTVAIYICSLYTFLLSDMVHPFCLYVWYLWKSQRYHKIPISYAHRLHQFSTSAFAHTHTLCLFFLHNHNKFTLRLTDISFSYSLYFFYLISILFLCIFDLFSPSSSMHVVFLYFHTI